ncbi:hypothetical protein [Mangrovibrevibacter kandeliae]|uniref:hypothetical protein n=1 Tax=Mangrovibrevibacter kandeliae TaxID=2968473 RepID=UPI0021195BE8|nr:hypothetical protein [Aurantimonas sp. CSK15Z-1]MCQ8781692.1 hypothetical protein [Aurantimonas sp. CSK15Z-1]
MTPEQYDRWKDFALRMARHAFPEATPARRAKIEASVENFFSWHERDSSETAAVVDWDSGEEYEVNGYKYRPCICDDVSSHLSEHYHERETRSGFEPRGNKFESQVSCCIRAGLDLASSPSAGVLGFTIGDLRRMYPEGLPRWVIEGFEPPITTETPDDAGVWL